MTSDASTKLWSFLLSDYPLLQERMDAMKPSITMGSLPKFLLNLFKIDKIDDNNASCLQSIEPKLSDALMEFQKEGVCFGIAKQGRCLIADEMGLGKTYQALGIADFYRSDWPLLICTTAATRSAAQHIFIIRFYYLFFFLVSGIRGQQKYVNCFLTLHAIT